MKAKTVTVRFEYTNFEVLELMLNRLKKELEKGKEHYEHMVTDSYGHKRYLQFLQAYNEQRDCVIENDTITIKSRI